MAMKLFRRRQARVRSDDGTMDSRWIFLESVSGEGIRSFGVLPFQKPCLYATVSLGRQRKKTGCDQFRGKNPKWDHPMRFDLGSGAHDEVLEFQVMCRGNPFLLQRVRHVGDVKIPVSALVADGGRSGGDGAVYTAAYQVRTPSGKANGVLSFSYRICFPRPAAVGPGVYPQTGAAVGPGVYPQTVMPVYVMPHPHPQQVGMPHPHPHQQQVGMPHPQQVGGAYYLAPAPYYPQMPPPQGPTGYHTPALPAPYGYRA